MPRLRRVNMDTSWHLEWGEARLLIDPWLIGSEVDGFRWFNEQWHITDPVAVDALPAYDAVLISQSYADHCHYPTLDALEAHPLLTVAKAQAGLQKRYPGREVSVLPEDPSEPLTLKGLQISALRPRRRLDPIYYAVVLRADEGAIVYCPHGFELEDAQAAWLRDLGVRALITTFTDFRLPSWLGGHVNPGLPAVERLVDQLRPHHVLNCHDEPKAAKGLVDRLARVERADLDTVAFDGARFLPTPDYAPVTV